MLAGLFDAVQTLIWVTICAYTEASKHPPRPEPLPRPGIEQPEQPSFHDNMRRLAALGG